MPFRDIYTHLRDIREAITHIEEFIGSMDLPAYQNDLKTKSAVDRQMQIITEAAIRLGDDGPNVCPALDWAGFRGMGNILRHPYHRIDDKIIWDTVKRDLPLMRDAVVALYGHKTATKSMSTHQVPHWLLPRFMKGHPFIYSLLQ